MKSFYDLHPDRQRQLAARRLFRYVRREIAEYHPFLRRLYREAGIDLAGLRTPDDVARLPLVSKQDLRENPQAFVLQPGFPGVEAPAGFDTSLPRRGMLARYAWQALTNRPRDLTRQFRQPTLRERVRRRAELEWLPIHFHASSGSTGRPTPAAYTHYDLDRVVRELASVLILPKQRDPAATYYELSERAMSLFPGAPHLAFFSSVLTKMAVGTCCFETCGGQVIPTQRQVRLFVEREFTSLLAIPSYLVHWLRHARRLVDAGEIGPLERLRHIVLGAEPVSDALRETIRSLAWEVGARPGLTIYETLGMTEMKWWFSECAEHSGIHLNPRYYYWELLDPDSRQPVDEGQPGVLVFSHIGWRGTALVRYWTGDLVKGGMRWTRCPRCGYTFPRIYGPVCRAEKDFTKIKGTLVDLSALVDVVRATPGVRNFQMTLDNENASGQIDADRLTINVLLEPGSAADDIERLLRDRVKQQTEVSPDEIVLEEDEAALAQRLFARTRVKAEYVLERRASHI